MRGAFLTILLCGAVALFGCGGDDSTSGSDGETSAAASEESTDTKPEIRVPTGPPPQQLEIDDLVEGEGAAAKSGDEVTVQYVGVVYESGEQFDASWDRGEPFAFTLGTGTVIPGWEEGIVGMKVGGRRELIIPPELAYGSQEAGSIKPNSTLIFIVDLVKIN